jgi:menaquinone-dependent protoporphyrinogen IX oxidase
VSEREGKLDDLEKARKLSIDDVVAKYGLNPVVTGFFGGILDFNKMNFVFRRTFGFIRPQLEKEGFKEKEPGVCDLRDFEEIRGWTRELVGKVRQ